MVQYTSHVNNEEDTGRSEHVYIKGCDEGNKK